jgi:hypothetical protein
MINWPHHFEPVVRQDRGKLHTPPESKDKMRKGPESNNPF